MIAKYVGVIFWTFWASLYWKTWRKHPIALYKVIYVMLQCCSKAVWCPILWKLRVYGGGGWVLRPPVFSSCREEREVNTVLIVLEPLSTIPSATDRPASGHRQRAGPCVHRASPPLMPRRLNLQLLKQNSYRKHLKTHYLYVRICFYQVKQLSK